MEVGKGEDGSAWRNLILLGCSDASFQPWLPAQPRNKEKVTEEH